MAVTEEAFAVSVGRAEGDPQLAGCLERAAALVDEHIRGGRSCPTAVRDGAVLDVAAGLLQRRLSGGSGAFTFAPDGQPVHLAKDPLQPVRSSLAPWRGIPGLG